MVKPFPTEILERIIYYYFKRDELLHTPEENFTLVTPTRGSTSLLLVSKDFRLLALPHLHTSISITQPHHWELLFRSGSGVLAGDGEGAKTRRSRVRELRIDMEVHPPLSLEPDGTSLSPQHGTRDYYHIEFSSVQYALMPCSLDHRWTANPPNLFPNLDRVTLLLSNSLLPTPRPSPTPWPPHLVHQLEQHHLEGYRKSINDPLVSFPESEGRSPVSGEKRLEGIVRRGLLRESTSRKSALFDALEPRNIWISLEDGKVVKDLAEWISFSDRKTTKHFVYPPHLPLRPQTHHPSHNGYQETPTGTFRIDLPSLTKVFLPFYDFESFAANLRFVNFPLDPPEVRRWFWHDLAQKIGEADEIWQMVDRDRRRRKGSEILLAIVKKKDWAWVEKDGRLVEFEEGLGEAVDNMYEENVESDGEGGNEDDSFDDDDFSDNDFDDLA